MYGFYFATATSLQTLFTLGSIFCPNGLVRDGIYGKDNNTTSVFAIRADSNGDIINGSGQNRSNFTIYGSYII
jgi:hypothetical protein